MGKWNYRLVQPTDTKNIVLAKVHYDRKGIPITHEIHPDLEGFYEKRTDEAVDAITDELKRMARALDEPVLTDDDFKGEEDEDEYHERAHTV